MLAHSTHCVVMFPQRTAIQRQKQFIDARTFVSLLVYCRKLSPQRWSFPAVVSRVAAKNPLFDDRAMKFGLLLG